MNGSQISALARIAAEAHQDAEAVWNGACSAARVRLGKGEEHWGVTYEEWKIADQARTVAWNAWCDLVQATGRDQQSASVRCGHYLGIR